MPVSALGGCTHVAAIASPGNQERAGAHASSPHDDAEDLFPTETRSLANPERIGECRGEGDERAHTDQENAKSSSCHSASSL